MLSKAYISFYLNSYLGGKPDMTIFYNRNLIITVDSPVPGTVFIYFGPGLINDFSVSGNSRSFRKAGVGIMKIQFINF